MMATFRASNIYVLLLVTCLGNAQVFYDYLDDPVPCPPPYPLTFGNNAGFIVPNVTDPCVAPIPQPNPAPPAGKSAAAEPGADSNCSVINPNGSLANGNSLFIILDPKSLQAILQVVPSCNKTNNSSPATGGPPPPPTGGPSPPPTGGPPPSAREGSPPLAPPAAAIPPDTGDTSAPVKGPPPAIPSDTGDAAPVKPLPLAPGHGPATDDAPNAAGNEDKLTPPVKRQATNPDATSLPVDEEVIPDNTNVDGVPVEASTPVPDVAQPGAGEPLPVPDVAQPSAGAPPPVPDVAQPGAGAPPPVPDVAQPGAGAPPPVTDANPRDAELPPIPELPPVDPNEIPLPEAPPIDNAIPPPPSTPGGLLCNLLTLIQTLVNAILQFVLNLLKQLIHLIVQLLQNIIRTLLGKLLPDVLKTLEQLLGTLVPNLLKDVGNLVNTALSDLLGKHESVPDLVNGLPVSVLGGGNSTSVIGAVNDIITEVEGLLSDILQVPVVDTVHLLSNVSKLLNNTLEDLLDDVDKLAEDLLTDLLGNSSVVAGLTTDVTTLLKDVLGDTVCNVEKLLTNSNSLGQLIQNLLKLIRSLLDDVLKDVDKLLVDKLVKLLGEKGLLDKLLDNLLKLLTDLLNNLLAPKLKKLENSQIIKNPDQFKKDALDKVTKSIPGSSVIPGVPVLGEGLALALDGLLEDLIKTVQNLLKNLKDLLVGKNSGLINNLLNSVRKLLDSLLKNLGKGVGDLLPPTLSNLINPSALLGPLGTVVTNILKLVVCDSCKKPIPPVTDVPPPVTDLPPVTTVPPIDTNSSQPCVPFYYPIQSACEDYIEDELFDNINDPESFVSGLNVYQDLIGRNIYKSIAVDRGDSLVDSLLGSVYRDCRGSDSSLSPLNFEELPNRLISGLEETRQLTSNLGSSGLWNLINALNSTTLSASPTIPFPPLPLPGAAPPPGSPPTPRAPPAPGAAPPLAAPPGSGPPA